jgi:hypothetical protein
VEKYRKVCRLRWCIWFVTNKAYKKLLLMTFSTTLVIFRTVYCQYYSVNSPSEKRYL